MRNIGDSSISNVGSVLWRVDDSVLSRKFAVLTSVVVIGQKISEIFFDLSKVGW